MTNETIVHHVMCLCGIVFGLLLVTAGLAYRLDRVETLLERIAKDYESYDAGPLE